MSNLNVKKYLLSVITIAAILFGSLSRWGSSRTQAQEAAAFIDVVRVMDKEEIGIEEPAGLAYSARLNAFYVIDAQQWRSTPGAADFVQVSPTDERGASSRLSAALQDPLNMAFDNRFNRMLVLQPRSGRLLQVAADSAGRINARSFQNLNVQRYGLRNPQGMAVDASTGELFILDASGPRLLVISPAAGNRLADGGIRTVDLASSGITAPRGLAIDPSSGNLHILSTDQNRLYEMTRSGDVTAMRDLSAFGLVNPASMAFAPSSDPTDGASVQSLYLADSGRAGSSDGAILELTLIPNAALPPGTQLLPASLVQIIDTSNQSWNPSAPDPAGVDYWPALNRLIITDSEVEEMPPYYQNKNVYISTTGGSLTGTCDTTYFTKEPTGIAVNPNNNHLFISDDAPSDKIYEIGLGPDNTYCTADDTVTTVLVNNLYGITDAEDVGYGNNRLFIAGGSAAEVFILPLGANGVLGGGDDGPLTHFDTKVLGFNDLEGVTYNPASGTLYIVSTKPSEQYLGEVTMTGNLLRAYNLSLMGSQGNIRSDVALGPGSQNPGIQNIYIASRGVDNNDNRNENDGRIWEINLGSAPPPVTPSITPTPGDPNSSAYFSFASNQSVGGVSSADEDVLFFDGTNWSMYFDGSDVGLTSTDLTSFHRLNASSFLFSLDVAITLNGVSFTPQDVIRFDATSLGSNTAGTFSMQLDGSDVGLDVAAEAIDALNVLPDGRYLLSFTGNPAVAGVSGGRDEDVLAFTPTSLGNNTSGTWAMYFDGSDVGLGDLSSEDVDALYVGSNGWLYLSVRGAFNNGTNSGGMEDVFICVPTSLGDTTACNYTASLFFDGSASGVSANVDGFNFGAGSGPGPTATPGPTSTPTNTATAGPSATPTATFTPTATSTPGGSDLIFQDGFESGNLSAWTSNKPDAGDLSASGAAALQGGFGMQAVLDDNVAIFVTDETPDNENRYRARFYFDPNSINMASGDAHFIFNAFLVDSSAVVRVEFQYSGGYQLRARILNDGGGWQNTAWIGISDAPHAVELDWRAASGAGANNGGVTFWIDGVEQASISNVDNDLARVNMVRLGAVTGVDTGTLGTYYFDSFVSRRQSYIGP